MRYTPDVLEVQGRAQGSLSPYAKFGWARISPAAGEAKNDLSVRHAFERQRFRARFRHEGIGMQKRF